MQSGENALRRVIQNEVPSTLCHSRESGIQSRGTWAQVWMPAFAGMTMTFLSHPPP